MFDATAAGAGAVGQAGEDPASSRRRHRAGGATVATDDEAGLGVAPPIASPVDEEIRAAALEIAKRLSIRPARLDQHARRGSGRLESVPYDGGADDIDLDRTLLALVENPYPADEDVIVRERLRTDRAVVLAVDVSGSMRGDRVRIAAAALGALAGELAPEELAVIAFWSDAAWLSHLHTPTDADGLVRALLELPTRGLTNVAFPLELAARTLSRSAARDRRAVLLSDCVHNAGPDPRLLAGALPRLDVLLDVTKQHDRDLARDLARQGARPRPDGSLASRRRAGAEHDLPALSRGRRPEPRRRLTSSGSARPGRRRRDGRTGRRSRARSDRGRRRGSPRCARPAAARG